MDCFRFDQALGILPMIQKLFTAEIGYHVSLVPSATPFSRNGIFSGRFLSEIQDQDPEMWQRIANSESSMNLGEPDMLKNLLRELFGRDISHAYHKVSIAKEGQRFLTHMKEYSDLLLIALVVNFVDLLTHHRAESDVLQEMIPE